MKRKIGNELKITNVYHGHEFAIGSIVKIIDIDEDEPSYLCQLDEYTWWVCDDEIETLSDILKNYEITI